MNAAPSSTLRYLPAAAIWLFACGFLILTYRLPVGARSTPSAVGWVTLGLATLDLLSRTQSGFGRWLMRSFNPAGLKPRPDDDVVHTRRDLLTGLALVVCVVAFFISLGVLATALLAIFGALTLAYRRQWIMNAVMAIVTTIAVWLLFAVLLNLQLYRGLVFGGGL